VRRRGYTQAVTPFAPGERLPPDARSQRLLQLGVLLFLLGLIVGFVVPLLTNPRMGLASHLEGVLNGMFLVILGLLWPRLALGARAASVLFWLALYGTFANWATTLLAAFWGAGTRMPLAAGAHRGTSGQELAIEVLLVTLSVAIVATCLLVLWGLRRRPASP
jgi:hydroxylaminobenzene mutase